MTKDRLERFTFETKALRGEYVYLETSIQTILQQHQYSEAMQRLLAECLAVVSLLSAMIKLEGRISLHFQGKGSLKLVLAQCNNRHEIRGLIKHDPIAESQSYQELLQCMKEGLLVVMLEFEARPGQPYHGIVQWTGNSLTDAIEAYFENSEQLMTRIWLQYNQVSKTIAGYMLQLLPEHESVDNMNMDFFQTAHQIQDQWHHQNGIGSVATFLKSACPEDDIQLFEPITVQFKCTCSRAHSENAIRLLGHQEANDEIEKNGVITVTCEFCTQTYSFDQIDVVGLFKNNLNDSASDSIH